LACLQTEPIREQFLLIEFLLKSRQTVAFAELLRLQRLDAGRSTSVHSTVSVRLSEWLLNSGAYMHWIWAMPV
jgi:hypothetical protein